MSEADTPDNPLLPKLKALMNNDDTVVTEGTNPTSSEQSEGSDLFALIKNLRERNRYLLKQVSELEQALGESQQKLQSQQTRSQAQETVIRQQTEALNATQDQINRLFHELESSHQVAQRQQTLIETLSKQLQSSQEQVAKLERESALVQQRYNEQSYQLLQGENVCRELQTRLIRQQRQTLQYKSALEKCLAVPAPTLNHKADPSSTTLSERHVKRVLAGQPFFSQGQPIQPWSVPDSVEVPLSHHPDQSSQTITTERSSDISKDEAIEELTQLETASVNPVEISTTDPTESDRTWEQEVLNELPDWAVQVLQEPDSVVIPETASQNEQIIELSQTNQPNLGASSNEPTSVVEAPTGTSAANSALPPEAFFSQENSPSPVLYPLRSPKLKSLAAVNLPNFPRSPLSQSSSRA